MQFTLKYNDGIFHVVTSGSASYKGFSDFYRALVEHEQWKAGGLIFSDHSELHAEGLSSKEVIDIANLCGEFRDSFGDAKLAIFVDRNVEYGLARMWQIYIGDNAWDVSQKLFRTKKEALAWLKQC